MAMNHNTRFTNGLSTFEYNHSDDNISNIIESTRRMAFANPYFNHTTYIVSFRSRNVIQIKASEGKVNVIEKGNYPIRQKQKAL